MALSAMSAVRPASCSARASLRAAPLRAVAAAPARGACRARRSVTRSAIKEIFMPALSSTMTEGKIVSWLKGEGDALKKGESVVVVESDKADMDVETFYDGFLAAITVPDGSVAAVGSPIAYIAETKEEIPAAKAKAAGSSAAAPAAAAPAPAAAAPPPPPPAAAAAPAAAPAAAAAAPPPPPPPPPPPAAAPARADGKVFVSPYAKKLASQLKVDLATVRGSGLAGRVTAADIEAAAGKKPAPAAAAAAPAAAKPAAGGAPAAAAPAAAKAAPGKPAAVAVPVGGRTEPLPGMQVAVAKNMLASLSVRTRARAHTPRFARFYAARARSLSLSTAPRAALAPRAAPPPHTRRAAAPPSRAAPSPRRARDRTGPPVASCPQAP
jgi:pyruvate dehydrogenase E2 component (dihydrolipoamide acetyltransferase)